ncbi:MAG TPA: CaiB/BaiF CoA-transferase family protein [Acidimicrobiia bacterium]|nr:CaiB/BaiF CoA-transferase family protein [Acidimicrobiia bacterium]
MIDQRNQQGPLAGIRVVDLTRVLAGPLCTMTLGDMGADIIKVEEPRHGDDTRAWGPPFVGPFSAYYLAVNRNKRSLTLDLKSEEGRVVLRRLIIGADVVIDNFKLGTMESWGFDDHWFETNAGQVVRCSITGYGPTGPKASKPGYDFILQAETGLMAITGEANGSPMKLGVAIVDVCAGLTAAIAVLGALQARARTGRGQRCEVSLHDVGLQMLINVASNHLVSGEEAGRYGNSHPNIVPYRTYPAADGEVAVAVGNDRQFAALAAVLGRPEWASDPRFTRNQDRVRNREAIDNEIATVISSRPRAHWIEKLDQVGIPVGPINSVAEALASPQTNARQMVVDLQLETGLATRGLGLPFQFSDTPSSIRRPPPALGADTRELLLELGLSDAEIDDLERRRVI